MCSKGGKKYKLSKNNLSSLSEQNSFFFILGGRDTSK